MSLPFDEGRSVALNPCSNGRHEAVKQTLNAEECAENVGMSIQVPCKDLADWQRDQDMYRTVSLSWLLESQVFSVASI